MKSKILTITVAAFVMAFSSCVQETHLKTVTFEVDMRNVTEFTNVGVRGPFTDEPWQETIIFEDNNGDSIYEGSITQKTAANGVEFKFVINNDTYELKDQNNRYLKFEYKPESIIYTTKFNDTTATIIKQ